MKLSSFKIYLLKSAFKRKGAYVLVVAIFIAIFCMPKFSSHAYYKVSSSNYFQNIQNIVSQSFKPSVETVKIYVTAYTSNLAETDNTPCITASGYNLCKHNRENVVACNFLPFGTKVRFPSIDPEKIYTVVDRMHERYNSRMDIWMKSKNDASQFGIKYLTVEIIK